MALEPVKLDDMTWNDMVAAIRSRIPADSEGRWTLHAPVDPGITLLELFAWLLEQRLYWMDQVPDSLVGAALALLGADEPKPAQAAATAIGLYDRAQSPQAFRTVDVGTKFQPVRSTQPPLIFSTGAPLTLLPVVPGQPFSLYIGGLDRTADLRQGRALRLFPADGSSSEAKVVLNLSSSVPAETPKAPFSLLFKLRVSEDILPQWQPDATADVPPPVEISWWYRGKNGDLAQFPSVDDGTGGFRRSGIVRFPFPADWLSETTSSKTGNLGYAIWIRVKQATFTAPPRIERLEPNVCIANNQWLVSPKPWREMVLLPLPGNTISLADHVENNIDKKKMAWLPLPGNTISLADHVENDIDKNYRPLEQSVKLSLTERGEQTYQWQATNDLTLHGPADRVFAVDRESRKLFFGDGLTGRLPVLSPTAETNVALQYEVGGGSEGNLEENLCWELAPLQAMPPLSLAGPDPVPSRSGLKDCSEESTSDLFAQNLVSAEGGADPETMAMARQRAAAQLRRLDRAVTRDDYEEIARTTPGVAVQRAHAAIGYHPSFPCMPVLGAVTVFIVPYAPREDIDETWVESAFVPAPMPDPGALSAVRERLESARLITSEIFVRAPRYRPIAIVAEVEADSPDPAMLKRRIEKALMTFLDPLLGGDEGQGWPFGESIRPSALLREIQKALGHDGEATGISIRLLETGQDSDCMDVNIGPHDLVELRAFSARFSQPRVRQGGLR